MLCRQCALPCGNLQADAHGRTELRMHPWDSAALLSRRGRCGACCHVRTQTAIGAQLVVGRSGAVHLGSQLCVNLTQGLCKPPEHDQISMIRDSLHEAAQRTQHRAMLACAMCGADSLQAGSKISAASIQKPSSWSTFRVHSLCICPQEGAMQPSGTACCPGCCRLVSRYLSAAHS